MLDFFLLGLALVAVVLELVLDGLGALAAVVAGAWEMEAVAAVVDLERRGVLLVVLASEAEHGHELPSAEEVVERLPLLQEVGHHEVLGGLLHVELLHEGLVQVHEGELGGIEEVYSPLPSSCRCRVRCRWCTVGR